MKNQYVDILDRFSSAKVLVIGDFILDVYLKGITSRLSPEAPVPVVDVTDQVEHTGGAANTAMNLCALGAEVTFMSVIGMDPEGWRASRIMKRAGVNTSRLLRHPKRKTIVKTRVMAGTHVITRYDRGSVDDIDEAQEALLIQFLRMDYGVYDAIVISDYRKGMITPAILKALIELQAVSPRFIAVDSKRLPFFKMLNPSFVKPNYEEAIRMLNLRPQLTARADQMQSAGAALYTLTAATTTAVTLDEDGALLFEGGQFQHRAFTPFVSAPKVAGAGDTFISTFVLASLSSAPAHIAADMACVASSIAVRKEGTALCCLQELQRYFSMNEKQVSSLEDLSRLCAWYKSTGKRIVFTNGCFDILHSGHVSYLNRARHLGDILIVGVNNDASIRRLKGENRPINPLADRIQVLAGLSAINHIISFGDEKDDTPISLINVVRPNIFVKGGDYTRDKLPEADTIEKCGGEIVFLSLVPDHSTTQIIQQIYKTSTLAVA